MTPADQGFGPRPGRYRGGTSLRGAEPGTPAATGPARPGGSACVTSERERYRSRTHTNDMISYDVDQTYGVGKVRRPGAPNRGSDGTGEPPVGASRAGRGRGVRRDG